MSDLISREEAISTIKSMLYQTALNSVNGDEKAALLYADIADNRVEIWLKLVDSVDAVPVFRCKDCKCRNTTGKYPVCELDSADPYESARYAEDDDWFCADGERRESE